MPTFKQVGRFLVSYATYKKPFALFPASQAVMDTHGDELKHLFRGQGHSPFHRRSPIPAVVKKAVKAQLEESAAGEGRP
jgi:uncharacterized protein YdhG (YjbR/CyaY superfamily)